MMTVVAARDQSNSDRCLRGSRHVDLLVTTLTVEEQMQNQHTSTAWQGKAVGTTRRDRIFTKSGRLFRKRAYERRHGHAISRSTDEERWMPISRSTDEERWMPNMAIVVDVLCIHIPVPLPVAYPWNDSLFLALFHTSKCLLARQPRD